MINDACDTERNFKPSYNRRCYGHDYKAPSIYLVTILKNDYIPVFASITPVKDGDKTRPSLRRSALGDIIKEMLARLEEKYPHVKIMAGIVMPDHVHFEIRVKYRTEISLSSVVTAFKAFCTSAMRERMPQLDASRIGLPVFVKGFNDKIAFTPGAKDAFYKYVLDNPRRYMVRRYFPQYFFHNTALCLGGKDLGLYGNIFLLDNPVKSAVKISRVRERTQCLAEREKEWGEVIRCGGVLVSPFINKWEREYMQRAFNEGAGVIMVVNYRCGERDKPYGRLFDLCAAGRLLIVSTERYEHPAKECSYLECQDMNRIAADIAAIVPGEGILKKMQGFVG